MPPAVTSKADGMDKPAPTLDEAKALIARLARADRAALRRWLLAAYDAQGNDRRPAVKDRDEPRLRG